MTINNILALLIPTISSFGCITSFLFMSIVTWISLSKYLVSLNKTNEFLKDICFYIKYLIGCILWVSLSIVTLSLILIEIGLSVSLVYNTFFIASYTYAS